MNNEALQEHDFLLAQLEALADAQVPAARRALFRTFLRHYYETASFDSLALRTPQELLDVALEHWKFTDQRKPGETRVRVLPPQDLARPGRAAMATAETCVDDMPFLVDSVSMAIRDAGSPIDWAVHPVLRMRRDGDGAISSVTSVQGGEDNAESLIHMEFEPLLDPEAYARLAETVQRVLGDLRAVVEEFEPMRARAREVAERLATAPKGVDKEELAEARELLMWLADNHFTFLGYSETEAKVARDGKAHFVSKAAAALGLVRRGARFADSDDLIAPRQELDKYTESVRVVVITKANYRSPVRHPEYMDVVSVKQFHEDGTVAGTCRFIGMFSAEAYFDRPRNIPVIRRKADYVIRRLRLPESSHSAKAVRVILHTLPRDELFQSSEEELYNICMGVRALGDRHQLKLFMRRDRYGRFYSCLVYLPRDRYSREIRDRIASELMEICNGSSVDRTVEFPRGFSARIHYIVRTAPGTRIPLDTAEVEQRLIAATRSWRDQLREVMLKVPRPDAAQILARFADAFPLSYTEYNQPLEAAADLQYLARLSDSESVLPRLLVSPAGKVTGLKLYTWRKPVELSDVMPALENFGLRVVRQEPAELKPKDSPVLWIQEFDVHHPGSSDLPPESQKAYFETAFLKAWTGETENDGLNRLVLGAGLDWRQVTCVRLITKYLIQTGLPFSQAYMEQLLADHAHIARLLVRLFEARFDPQLDDARRNSDELKLGQALDDALDKVASLDGDRVLRAFLSVVRAGLRTNYYQSTQQGERKSYVSLKLDPRQVAELPQPLPMFEVFVYAPEVEGIHLRGGKVARGGLRWSDRRQDFRTEVLGLMKAQMVKNTVIVPVGAKGGFVPKKGDPTNREEWLKTGVECYKTFLRGLLDIADNRVKGEIVPPADVVRHDEDDPYLVVAADKGTATFSDIANGLAGEYGFWLGDAFASGGSAGYDHKKMGITARGAWECVKRHFREIPWTDDAGVVRAGKDIQSEEFSVVGIGDMSGDVFGNGMLLSRKIRLIAAFDHRHIFIDPHPDAEKSFVERERMFRLPRSSWADYKAELISAGGGVYPRSAKSIKLSDEAKKALGVTRATLAPNEVISAILKAPVDLLWNGGIGTYVKASTQSHLEVGDRSSEPIRVNGRDLRCKVVGEGGNLGLTQLGRVEFALGGGRINTDAIDNAGGVHSSDREVNIKIPLNQLMAEGSLAREERDPLLAQMTDDVARAVLYDNYVQSAAISLMEQNAAVRLDEHANLMRTLERDGLLNRTIEFLPDDETLKERRTQGKGLTRPELCALLAYSKISLNEAMLRSDVPDDAFFGDDLLSYFPPALVKKYREPLLAHRLRREIIATMLTNAVVNRMGASFSHRLAEDHGVPRAVIIKAYAAGHQIYEGDRFWLAIQALDNKVTAKLQYKLFERAIGLLKHVTSWLVNSRTAQHPIGDTVQRFAKPVKDIEKLLPECLPPSYREDWNRTVAGLQGEGVPEELAVALAKSKVMGSALDIAELAEAGKVSLAEAASVYFQTGERFRFLWMLSAIVGISVQTKWHALARANLRDDVYRIQRMVSQRILLHKGKTPEARIDAWIAANQDRVKFVQNRITELQSSGAMDFMGLVVAARDLRKLRAL